jgi:acyl-coenzyme A thioesterase PaaI-like protein
MIKQLGSKMCFVCGVDNPIGLHLDFWMDGEQVWTEFTPGQQHQGYPGVLHGGLIAALLDETMGRAAYLKNLWMVTAKMELSYRKPVPLEQPLTITAHIDELHGSRMTVTGQLLLPGGIVAVEGHGLYLRLPEERLAGFLDALAGQGVDVSSYMAGPANRRP